MFVANNSSISSIVIVGAGGFGLEIYDYLVAAGGPSIAGFLDDTPGSFSPAGTNAPFLGTIDNFLPKTGQVAVIAVGSVSGRQAVLSRLWIKGVKTPAFIAPGAMVSPSAVLDRGVVVCPFSIINRNARLAQGVVVNVHCSVGHGARVGAFSVLSPYAALNGDAVIGDRCFLGTRATINPRIHIGDDCIVDSHAAVRISSANRKIISSRGQYQVSDLMGTPRSK